MALRSISVTKAIHLPSGDQAGERSGPGLVVTWVRCAPLSVLSAAVIEVADGVLFELQAVDDERRGSFWFCGGLLFVLFFSGFNILGLGVLEDKDEASAIEGPF